MMKYVYFIISKFSIDLSKFYHVEVINMVKQAIATGNVGPLLLTWINFNPSMDK